MKKAVQLFVTALLVTCVVFVFAGCIDNKEKTYVEQYTQITANNTFFYHSSTFY